MSLARLLTSSLFVLGLVACDDAATTGNNDTTDTVDTTPMDTTPVDVAPDTVAADTSPADVALDTADTTPEDVALDTADTTPADIALDTADTADTTPADVAFDTADPIDASATGACNNEGDLATLRTEEITLAGKIQTCVFQCLASGAACSSDCLQQSTELSSGCADCFGGVIACTIANCAAQCFTPTSEACNTCRDQNCTPDFEACAGIQQP